MYIATMAFDESDSRAAKANASARIVDQMMAEMQYATRFTERTSTAVTFHLPDRDGDGDEETIRYAWSGASGAPLTKQFNGGPAATLIDAVESLNFDYMTKSLPAESGGSPE